MKQFNVLHRTEVNEQTISQTKFSFSLGTYRMWLEESLCCRALQLRADGI